MDQSKLPAWWAHRQGLDGALHGRTPAAILAQTGWARSVGGAGPYLTLFARGGLSRESVDAAVANLEIHELPSARGCTYVLPAGDYALGLTAAQGFNFANDMRTASKLGVTETEIEKLCGAILAALESGPMDPEQLKQATGDAARSLGPEGVKKGLGNTTPVALAKLQEEGRIRRLPANGRLDQQRYRYALWKPNPLAAATLTREQIFSELARRYFQWIGPATLAEFQWFSGLGAKAAKAAVEPLGLVPFEPASGRCMFREDRDAFENFKPPKKPSYTLVSSLDGMFLLRRDVSLLTAGAGQHERYLGGLTDLPNHAILDRGRIAGLWEYDPEARAIAWKSFDKPDAALKNAVAQTERYIRDQLGDARAFSLDSPKSRATRIAALRA